MRKPYLYFSIIFFLLSAFILFLSPSMEGMLRSKLINSDFLFPFSLYEGITNQINHPVWVFGGYTPFTELLLGFLLWLPFKNILLTYILFAFVQICFVTASVMYLTSRIVGSNPKIFSLTITISAFSIIASTTGNLNNLNNLYFWYLHITTFYLGLISFSLLIDFSTAPKSERKRLWTSILILFIVSLIAIVSDALFISQFIAPAGILVIIMILMAVIPFRRGIIALICLFSSTALGFALFQIPQLWGSERIILTGYFIQFTPSTLNNGLRSILDLIRIIWGGHALVAVVWILFIVFCLIWAVIAIRRWLKNGLGIIRKKLGMCILFFIFQLTMTLSAALISVDIALRYFLPVLFIPLLWGWPILAITRPGWMKFQYSKYSFIPGLIILILTSLLLIIRIQNIAKLAEIWHYYPADIQCIDTNASRLSLHYGIAQYWDARPITLLSKSGLLVVQALPDLQAFPFLDNKNVYHNEFEFIIVNIGSQTPTSIDRGLVIQRFGEPASSFSCTNYEVMVYNRAGDNAFAQQFIKAGY